jgi:hypothetical protein
MVFLIRERLQTEGQWKTPGTIDFGIWENRLLEHTPSDQVEAIRLS